ncbi:MAG: hypothetical protein NT037_10460 [Hyphomicrobiales bacterium]|nr:hypothetical protein [Hyphomicrobiales bacterium]
MTCAATPVAPRQTLGALADYGISATTGFVPEAAPLVTDPDWFSAWGAVARDLAALIGMRRVRHAIRVLPPLDVAQLAMPAEQESVFLALSVLKNAWVWGDAEPDVQIPANPAVPVCQLAAMLGRKPLVLHASMTLQTCRRVDLGSPVSADNATVLLGFPGGSDETWSFTATLGIEILGAPLIAAAADAARHADAGDLPGLARALWQLAEGLPTLIIALERTQEWCDPYIVFYWIGPHLAGWPEPGAIYEGVWPNPVVIAGGSAGQRSLIQTSDPALGISHEGQAGAFLREMRNSMPTLYRAFVQDFAAATVRQRVAVEGHAEPRAAYGVAVEQRDIFRRRHIGLSVDDILKPSGRMGSLGTGGTSFVDLLREARVGTAKSAVGRTGVA